MLISTGSVHWVDEEQALGIKQLGCNVNQLWSSKADSRDQVNCFNFKEQKHSPSSIHSAKMAFCKFLQGKLLNCEHLKKFNSLVETVMAHNGKLHDHPMVEMCCKEKHSMEHNNLSSDTQKKMHQATKQAHLACVSINQSYQTRHDKSQAELENDCIKGLNNYSQTLVKVHQSLNEHQDHVPRTSAPISSDIAFTQQQSNDDNGCGMNDKPKGPWCFECRGWGHCVNACPSRKQDNSDTTAKEDQPNQWEKTDNVKVKQQCNDSNDDGNKKANMDEDKNKQTTITFFNAENESIEDNNDDFGF